MLAFALCVPADGLSSHRVSCAGSLHQGSYGQVVLPLTLWQQDACRWCKTCFQSGTMLPLLLLLLCLQVE